MSAQPPTAIPILTDVAAHDAQAQLQTENLIAELKTRLASSTFALTEELVRAALNETEAKLYAEITTRLRRELPELIDTLLREYLAASRDP